MQFGPTLEYWYAGTFLLLAVLQYQASWRQKARELRAAVANLLKGGIWLVLRMAKRSITGAPGMAVRIMFWIGRGAKGLVIRPKALAESPALQTGTHSATVTTLCAANDEVAGVATVAEGAVDQQAIEEMPLSAQAIEEMPASPQVIETIAEATEIVAPVAETTAEVAQSDAAETEVDPITVTPVEAADVQTPVEAVTLSAQNDNTVETAIAAPDAAEQTEKIGTDVVAGQTGVIATADGPPAARHATLPRISLRARLSAPLARLFRRTGTGTDAVTTPDRTDGIDRAATADNAPVAALDEGAAVAVDDAAVSMPAATSPVLAETMLVPEASSAEAGPPAYVYISGMALDRLAADAQTTESDSDRLARRVDKVIGFRATSGEPSTTASQRFDGVLFKAGDNLLKWLPGNSNIDLWHLLVSQMTFDSFEEFKIAAWIVDRPLCDHATAAMVLAQISAEDCMHFGSAEECKGLDRYRWQIARTICERSEKGRYFFCDFNLRQAAEHIDLAWTLKTLRRRANELVQEGKTLPWPVPTELLTSAFDGRDAVCEDYHVDGMTLWLPTQKAAA